MVLFFSAAAGSIVMADPGVRASTQAVLLVPHPQVAFYPGEKFEFDIKYEFIHAGKASLEVTRSIFVASRPTLGFLSIARSNGFVDNFFKVRDFNGSQVDEASLASVNFHQNLREGGYKVLRTTSINYELGKYFFEKVRKGNTTKQEGPITLPVSDILSSFFYTRTLPLEPGKEYSFPVFSDQEIYQMKVVVGPKIEKIRVEAGEFLCLRVTPQVIGDAIFQASDGKMTIWMTNDERKMPVLIRSKVAVGAFDAELTKYRPGTNDQP